MWNRLLSETQLPYFGLDNTHRRNYRILAMRIALLLNTREGCNLTFIWGRKYDSCSQKSLNRKSLNIIQTSSKDLWNIEN